MADEVFPWVHGTGCEVSVERLKARAWLDAEARGLTWADECLCCSNECTQGSPPCSLAVAVPSERPQCPLLRRVKGSR